MKRGNWPLFSKVYAVSHNYKNPQNVLKSKTVPFFNAWCLRLESSTVLTCFFTCFFSLPPSWISELSTDLNWHKSATQICKTSGKQIHLGSFYAKTLRKKTRTKSCITRQPICRGWGRGILKESAGVNTTFTLKRNYV